MARKLYTYVTAHQRDADGNPTGRTQTFGPNDDLSRPDNAWAAEAITNPDVWEGAETETDPEQVPGAPVQAPDGPPPKGGAGSGAPVWREYAAKNNVDVPADASRDDIIAALDAANVRTE